MARPLLILATLAATASAALAVAQSQPAAPSVESVQREAADAARRSTELENAAARAVDEAAKARAAEAALATRVLATEAEIATAEVEVRRIAQLRATQRARLADQQAPIIRLTAALQTMARRPPALALVQPGSLSDVVHVRALLDAQLPAIGQRTAGLRQEVSRGLQLQHQADLAAGELRTSRQRMQDERTQLAKVEAQQQIRAQALTDDSLDQSDRALALGEEARNLSDLIGRLDAQAGTRDRLAALPGPVLRPPVPGHSPPPPQAETASETRLTYRLPVNGKLLRGLGEISEAGIRARGLTIGARADALVVAPARGRIAYAGPFRGYGNIVIIEHGGGWTSLVTGLSTLRAEVGEAVDQGSPVGRAHGGTSGVTVELRRGGQPIDIVPLLGRG
ncbi:membrane protein [Sphingomonas sp. DBB INV C78]|uniref:murein hydrolase activator EnvC family protein n=1 Tax=Sphingomonas sp. DBB INV C78 TaxID=3349434 RepID=UPI0036D37B8E